MNLLTQFGIMAQKTIFNVMRIATSITGTDACAFSKTALIDSTKTTIFESEIKVETAGSSYGQIVQIANGARLMEINLKSGSVVFNSLGASPYTYTADNTSAFHTYRLEFQGTTQVVCLVDGNTVCTIPYADLYAVALNRIFLGDGVSTANCGGSMLWKTIRYNLDFIGTPTTFTEWSPDSKPNAQGWTLGGTDLATIIQV